MSAKFLAFGIDASTICADLLEAVKRQAPSLVRPPQPLGLYRLLAAHIESNRIESNRFESASHRSGPAPTASVLTDAHAAHSDDWR